MTTPAHFDGKEALQHVTENYAKGVIAASEIHGTEIPGAISAGADAAKEWALIFLLLWTLFHFLNISLSNTYVIFGAFSLGFIIWKTGRSALLSWARLERLHRIAAQEKWEIEHNRAQEREELTALYRAKGFEGKLLTDVIDVLMSDGDLLLRVMLEEELGLSLEVHEHPLQQAFGAFLGTLLSIFFTALLFYLSPDFGPLIASFSIAAVCAFISSKYEQNDLLNALIWNLGLFGLVFGTTFFFMHFLQSWSST